VTCVQIDGLSDQEIVNKINYYNEPDRYQSLCLETYQNFNRLVKFDQEASTISNFLNNLL
jgi:hypothetical protein